MAILELLTAAGLPASTAAAVAGLAWVGNKHVQRDKEREKETHEAREALDARLRALESDRIVKADLNRVYDKVDSLGTELRAQNADTLEKLLAAVAQQGGPRRG